MKWVWNFQLKLSPFAFSHFHIDAADDDKDDAAADVYVAKDDDDDDFDDDDEDTEDGTDVAAAADFGENASFNFKVLPIFTFNISIPFPKNCNGDDYDYYDGGESLMMIMTTMMTMRAMMMTIPGAYHCHTNVRWEEMKLKCSSRPPTISWWWRWR